MPQKCVYYRSEDYLCYVNVWKRVNGYTRAKSFCHGCHNNRGINGSSGVREFGTCVRTSDRRRRSEVLKMSQKVYLFSPTLTTLLRV